MGLRRVCPDVRFLGSYPRADDRPLPDRTVDDAIYRDAAAWLGRVRNGRM
jgi:prephenate dehydratase